MGLLLLILVIVLLIGVLPTWGYSRKWGAGPSGGLGLVLLVLVILLLMGVLPHGMSGGWFGGNRHMGGGGGIGGGTHLTLP